ncbi:MAG: pyridoxine 5'-phosphate synthase [Candidatus Aadella gelida]|nr:pyridoxine 5'-phosphate synthase [Candidatus Aadella gelida]
MKLGVNIDHIATVRQARRTFEPDPVQAATESEKAGCDSIVCHLRKDRRHISDKDLELLKKTVRTKLNMEVSIDPEIVDIAARTVPDQATLVPEKRMELTTEGGLDVCAGFDKIKHVVGTLTGKGIEVSLFIDPDPDQIEASGETGAKIVEFHTGRYAEAFHAGEQYEKELDVIVNMTELARNKGLVVCAGHGLTYANVALIAGIKGIEELNIGHSIISRALFSGVYEAVKEMLELIK